MAFREPLRRPRDLARNLDLVGGAQLAALDHAGIEDPVAALVFGAPRPVELLLVGGGSIVRDGELRTVGEEQLAEDLKRASRKLNRVEATR